MPLQASPSPAPVTVPHCVGSTISPTQRRKLARAVSDLRRRVVSINADNKKDGVIPSSELDARLDAGVCVVVTVRAGLLAVDFDHTPVETVDGFVVELEEAGLEPVVIASGGEGRRHVWVRTNDPAWPARARQLGGDVRQAIRPPGVRHRTGVPSRLLNVSATEALRRLRRPRGHTDPAPAPVQRPIVALGTTGVRLPLPDAAQFASASEAVRAASCRFHGRGALPGDLVRAMDDTEWSPWMARLAKNGRERSIRWLVRHVWPTEPAPTADVCDEPVIEAAVAAAYARATSEIVGRPAPATMRVLDVLIARARQHSTLIVGLSVRQGAEVAGVSKRTAEKALRRLVAAGVIVRVTLGRGGRGGTLTASEWRILGDDTTESRTLRTPPRQGSRVPTRTSPAPCARRHLRRRTWTLHPADLLLDPQQRRADHHHRPARNASSPERPGIFPEAAPPQPDAPSPDARRLRSHRDRRRRHRRRGRPRPRGRRTLSRPVQRLAGGRQNRPSPGPPRP